MDFFDRSRCGSLGKREHSNGEEGMRKKGGKGEN